MIFVTKVYPKLMFYITSRPEPFYFDRGVFNTDDGYDPREKAELEKTLTKLANSPGFSGVQIIEDSKLPHVCETCQKGFSTQAALFGHLGSHKSEKQINEEASREGSTLPGDVQV